MKTRILLFLLCLVTLNVMGQPQGTITRKKKEPAKQEQKVSHYGKTSSQSGGNKRKASSGSSSSQKNPNAQAEINKLLGNMVYVQGGIFTMGATSEQGSDADSDEKPTHQVTLSSYYIGKYEVTQALWKSIMGTNPSNFKGDNLPVETVSWNDCKDFLNKQNSRTGRNFRLPTEAEWEYACRGGNKSRGYKYSGSNYISDVAWYDDNSGSKTHPVGTKFPNELGLYDMSGNVYEWCNDWKGDYSSSSQRDPVGPSSGSRRVNRGGSWISFARVCRSSGRYDGTPVSRYGYLGLRLVLSEL